MKILIFNTFYFPKFVGGAEISVQLLAEKLIECGHEVSVVTIGEDDGKESINGVNVIRLRQRNLYSQFQQKKKNAFVKTLWHIVDSYNPFYNKKIASILDEIQPEVVHTNNIQGFSPLIWKIIKTRGIPLVHTVRDYYLLCHRSNMFNNGKNCESLCQACKFTYSIKRRLIDYPDVVVGVSNFILQKHQAFTEWGNKNMEVVYNAIDVPTKPKESALKEVIRLGYMGRISNDKGVDYLVDEVLKLNETFRNKFKLILAGRGEESYIKFLTEKLQDVDFEFLGVVTPSVFYQLIDVCIVPSKWNEPFGRVAVESLAHCTPVCLAASGGLSEIHRENCTWKFKPKKNNLFGVLEQILNNPSVILEKRKYAYEYALSFSADSYIKNYQRIYLEQIKTAGERQPKK